MATKYYSNPKLARVKRRDEWDPYGGFIGDDYPDPNKLKGMDGGSIAGKTNWKHWKLIEVGTPDPIARIEGVRLRAGLFNEDKNQHLRGYYTSPPHPDTDNLPVFTYLPIDWNELSAWATQKGDLPRPEFVVFGGNYVEVIGEINNDYIIRVMDIDNLDLTSTPDNDPLVWQQMTSVSQDGSHGNAPRGYTFVFPNVGKGDRARIEKGKIEFVDSFTPLWKTTDNGQTNNDSGQPTEGGNMKKLMQVWRWYDYPVEQVIEWANKCGLDSLSIKFADGPNPYGKPNTSKEQKASDLLNYILALKNAGFEVGGWMWLYGFYPEKEAAMVKWGFDELGLSFVQLNIEANMSPVTAWMPSAPIDDSIKRAKDAGRRLMTEMWNLGLNGKEIHLNSHRFPAYFPTIPWDLFCKPQRWGWLQPLVNIISHHAPQVIHAFKDDAAAELRESHDDLMAIYPLKFCAMGTAHEWYSGGTKWEPTAQDFQEFIIQANDLGCERVGWYKLEYLIEESKQDWADAIRTTLHDPDEPEPNPDPDPTPEPTDCDAAIAEAVAKRDQEIIDRLQADIDFIKGQ